MPDYGALEDDEHAIEVTGRAVVDYTFARIFGLDSATVVRSATAKAKPGDGSVGSGLFFAGDQRPARYGVTINGSHQRVEGSIHSNTKMRVNGSHQTIIGDVEYLNSYLINGNHFTHDGDFVESTVQPYPVDFTWEQFDQGPWDHDVSSLSINGANKTVAPGRWRIRGNMTVNGSRFHCDGCLFVVDGTVMINGSRHILDNTIFVSQNTITFNGGIQRYSALVDNLFAFSTLSYYDWTAITMNGADQETWGMFYAPNAGLVYNGSGQEIHHGGLIAKTITINGSSGTFCGFGDGGSGGSPEIELIK